MASHWSGGPAREPLHNLNIPPTRKDQQILSVGDLLWEQTLLLLDQITRERDVTSLTNEELVRCQRYLNTLAWIVASLEAVIGDADAWIEG